MAKLTLDRLTKVFPGTARPAVDAVSLTVRDGGFLALLGPSGCGKTTILRMIAGFEQPTDGAITLGDRLISTASGVLPPEERNMAMVFQSYALWPHMTVAGNVGYPLRLRGMRGASLRGRIMDALDVVRLADFAERRPAELSGGQRQRVALARCLVASPGVVLLDEPLANLDRHLRAAMEETFRDFHRQSGATMVYVTHDQSEAMALATDVAVLSAGRLEQMAPPEEIYQRPEGTVVGALVGQGRILSLRLPDGGGRSLLWPEIAAALQHGARSAARPVLVRPESVRFDAAGMPASVTACVFTGERFVVDLALCDGQPLRAFSALRLAIGARAPVVVDQAWLLTP
ncbi:ABC transporter ATP-binding protein [Rhizobium sp. TRM95111]|uniref:ABC transporter ATP-binding protein n=1 Tax=Rhizobium alarense TaxID=2846851 RepID=UPI001F45A934|nr:ABC transporter ATP-binding protein [Rhizobium alarense]MCF3640531.1 ABC transporter ATP-binding protein [Rhizobium alarense]